jgi:hypothetical protein
MRDLNQTAKQNYLLQMTDINKRQPQSRSPGSNKTVKTNNCFLNSLAQRFALDITSGK